MGGYILGRTLGEGSFAKVRQGVHVVTNEKVSEKLVHKFLPLCDFHFSGCLQMLVLLHLIF